MKEVISDIDAWLTRGERQIALATVIETWGSAPRKVGAKMAFTAEGAAISGSVSGGCVEGAVIESGSNVLLTGEPQLLRFGVPDETAWGVGLACGGTIEVFVERLDLLTYELARHLIRQSSPVTIATVVRGKPGLIGRKRLLAADGSASGSLDGELDEVVDRRISALSRSTREAVAGMGEIFYDVLRPAPRVVIIGGAHIAVTLVEMAHALGYRSVVVDPRRAFGSAARFPNVGQLIHAWPETAMAELGIDADTAVVTLSHDPKIDDPALSIALRSDAFYIGALGSRKTHEKRRERLLKLGIRRDELQRIHAPIGLDIGAESPEEIALAIMSEIVAARRGRLGRDQ